MHPRIYYIPTIACFLLICALLAAAPNASSAPQTGNDCRTTASGNWNVPATWENCGGGVPGAGDNAFVQAGHIVTLVQNNAVNDLHISTGTISTTIGADARVVLGGSVLELNGKLRTYFAAHGTTPGTSSDAPPAQPITMTQSSASRLRVVGGSRQLTAIGEWGANTIGNANTFHLEIAVNPDATVVISAPVKAGDWSLLSGTLDVNDTRVSADRGTNGTGDVTVGANATLISRATGTAGDAVVSRTTSTSGGTLTVNGRLVLKGNNPYIAMTTLNLAGTVEYAGANQTLARATSGGASPNLYGTLVLTSTGNKSLSVPITVTTRLVRGGTSNLVLGSNTLTYDPGAAIEYAGTAAQITGPELPANIGGLVIANSAGATLTANTTVNTLLDLASGDLATGAFTLDLGAGATCSGSGDVLGATRRSTVAPGSTYCFGHPDVHAGVNAGSTAPTTLTVTLARGSAPFTAAVLRQYVVVAPGFSGVATLRLHYRTDELNGNSADDLVLWRHDGVRWIAQTPSAAGSGYVEKNDVTTFSDWAMAADGGSTAVDVSTFAAQQAGDQVLLTWSTASEVDVAGFHLHRSASVDGARERITASLIPARASGQVAGAAYEWTTPTSGGSWHFWLETVHLQGASTWHGPAPMKARRVYLPVISGKQP